MSLCISILLPDAITSMIPEIRLSIHPLAITLEIMPKELKSMSVRDEEIRGGSRASSGMPGCKRDMSANLLKIDVVWECGPEMAGCECMIDNKLC